MVSLRRQSQGLVREQEHGALLALRLIFNVIIACIAISGLIGVIVFFYMHWTSFS